MPPLIVNLPVPKTELFPTLMMPSFNVVPPEKSLVVVIVSALLPLLIKVPTPLFSATLPVYAAALKQGHAEDDTAAVCAVLEGKARVKRRRR